MYRHIYIWLYLEMYIISIDSTSRPPERAAQSIRKVRIIYIYIIERERKRDTYIYIYIYTCMYVYMYICIYV